MRVTTPISSPKFSFLSPFFERENNQSLLEKVQISEERKSTYSGFQQVQVKGLLYQYL